mmetsp:Transcript_26445/g.39111  ORF Transcript_26445/g.39111 Transcript_26445/m.39111 type:complete len:183 (-) Transcript_26445:123-671(-)
MLQRLVCSQFRRAPGSLLFSTYPRNPNLKQIIKQGMPYLEECTKEVIEKTKDPLFSPEDIGPSAEQLSEAKRILEVTSSVMESIANKSGEFCIAGEQIFILDCEVSPCLKRARVLWCIPPHLGNRLPEASADKLTVQMQDLLDKRGHKIQSHVFGRLRNYYPPRIKFVPIPVKVAVRHFLEE